MAQSRDLVFLWLMEDPIQDTWLAKISTKERCLEESLESQKTSMATLPIGWLSKQENNTSEERVPPVTSARLRLYWPTFPLSSLCGMDLKASRERPLESEF